MANLIIQIDASRLSMREYARRTGQTYVAVKRQVDDGKIPVVYQGTKRMVNNAKIIESDLNSTYGGR